MSTISTKKLTATVGAEIPFTSTTSICPTRMVIWDNRGVLHRAPPYDPTSPRDMHRTTLHGTEAIQ